MSADRRSTSTRTAVLIDFKTRPCLCPILRRTVDLHNSPAILHCTLKLGTRASRRSVANSSSEMRHQIGVTQHRRPACDPWQRPSPDHLDCTIRPECRVPDGEMFSRRSERRGRRSLSLRSGRMGRLLSMSVGGAETCQEKSGTSRRLSGSSRCNRVAIYCLNSEGDDEAGGHRTRRGTACRDRPLAWRLSLTGTTHHLRSSARMFLQAGQPVKKSVSARATSE